MAKDNDNDYVYLIRIDWDLEKSIRENPNINFIKVKETNNDNNQSTKAFSITKCPGLEFDPSIIPF